MRLSRGQEIALEVDESKAVAMMLDAGEMSLHHIGIAHGSKANSSDQPRIGIAVRYIAPEVVQKGAERQIVQLVRGRDEYGHFDIVGPPADAVSAAEIRKEADRRITKNVMPDLRGARASAGNRVCRELQLTPSRPKAGIRGRRLAPVGAILIASSIPPKLGLLLLPQPINPR